MRRGRADQWFPLWGDSWIYGGTRRELIIIENGVWTDYRGILIDLYSLALKDDGFIRANEEMSYTSEQLAGMFNVPLDKLEKCIELCLKYKKLIETSPGVYYVKSKEAYELTERHKRRFKEADSAAPVPQSIHDEFETLWDAWPGEKGDKGEDSRAFREFRQKETIDVLVQAFTGYLGYLKQKRNPRNGDPPFDQEPMYMSTFLRDDRWKRFLDFKYQPPL